MYYHEHDHPRINENINSSLNQHRQISVLAECELFFETLCILIFKVYVFLIFYVTNMY